MGYVREKYEDFVVTAYSQPTIIFNNIYRCDSSGNPSATGVYAKIEYTPKISSVNSLNSPIVKVKYKKGAETQFSDYITLSSSPSKINGNFALASSYDFVLEITDSVTKTPFKVERTLSSGNIPFNIKNGGNGAAFGCYSERENELTVGYDLNVRGSIKYNDLSSSVIVDSKFNSMFLEVKNYTCLGLTTIKSAFAFPIGISVSAVAVVGLYFPYIHLFIRVFLYRYSFRYSFFKILYNKSILCP